MSARPLLALAAAALLAASCGQLVRYTDELASADTGRSAFVTIPADIGNFLGFAAGIPLDVAALPVTYVAYEIQRNNDPITADPTTMLFPSWALGRIGTLIAVPFDGIDWILQRAWREETTQTAAQREEFERQIDQNTLKHYPVETIYPPPGGRG